MRSRWLVLLFSLGVVACAGDSCGPNLDFSAPDECTPAGGTCYGLFCGGDSHAENRSGCGLLGVCCMPGAPCEGRCATSCGKDETRKSGSCGGGLECCEPKFVPSPSFDDGAPPPQPPPPTHGFCNLVACAAGCTCRDEADDAGTCEAVCECPDGGVDAGDAGTADAGGDADAAAADAGIDDAGDGGDAEAGDGTCGIVTCADGCTCYDPMTSECSCPNTCPAP